MGKYMGYVTKVVVKNPIIFIDTNNPLIFDNKS